MRNLCRRFARRCGFFFKEKYWPVVSLAGLLFDILAVGLSQSHPLWAGVLGGIGGSILATVLVSFAGPAGDRVYHNFLSLGVEDFYPSRSHFPSERWVNWLREAKRQCILLGHAHGNWCDDPNFKAALIDRLREGVRVEMFFLDPTGQGIETRKKEDGRGQRNTTARISSSIKIMWNIQEDLDASIRDKLILRVYDATPSVGVTWIDNSMLVTHYLPGSVNLTSPCLLAEPRAGSKSVYMVYEENVRVIRDLFSILITRDNVAKFTRE